MKKANKFALFAHPEKPGASQAAAQTQDWLRELGMEVVFDEAIIEADAAVSFGGDGFALDVANKLPKSRIIPLARVNFGTLGFLTNIEPSEIREKMANLMDGQYVVTARNRLQVTYCLPEILPAKGLAYDGLNDIVIERATAKTIRMAVSFGNERIPIWADGALLATRTGSTGYNRVLGGPIIIKENQVVLKLMGSAVENHNAYVLPVDTEFSITVEPSNWSRLVVDGKEVLAVANRSVMTVKLAPRKTYFVEFGDVLL